VKPPAELGLAQRWRDEAALLRRRAAPAQADVLESCAAELEAWVRERELEVLTLDRASEETGFSYSALEKMVRAGKVANVGRKGRPRVRRGDLPRKPTQRPAKVGDRSIAALGLEGDYVTPRALVRSGQPPSGD
jgi:hypothetical protein